MDGQEVYHRLNKIEQEVHTLTFRVASLEGADLSDRVLTMEGSVARIGKDVDRMEITAACIKNDVASIKAWSRGVAIAMSGLATAIGLMIAFGGLFR